MALALIIKFLIPDQENFSGYLTTADRVNNLKKIWDD